MKSVRVLQELLYHIQYQNSFHQEKPKFPDEIVLSNNDVKDSVGPGSWLLFHLLHMSDSEWLNLPAQNWLADKPHSHGLISHK